MKEHQTEELPVRYYSSLSAKWADWLFYPYIPYGKAGYSPGFIPTLNPAPA
jgi:hypothetical protein